MFTGPPELSLYTITGSVTKGGVTLPIYRCARGTMTLESILARLVIDLLRDEYAISMCD